MVKKRCLWMLGIILLLWTSPGFGGDTPREPEMNTKLANQARQVVRLLFSGRFTDVYNRFDDKMKEVFPKEKMQAFVGLTVLENGELKNLGEARIITPQPGYRVVVVDTEFEWAKYELSVTFDDDNRIAGIFTKRIESIPGRFQSPAYGDPEKFTEKEVHVGSYKLPGSITLPRRDGPFPAVVLIHGSGPQDQDETIGGHKPFRDLAWGLASRNIAVLRYTKRTKHVRFSPGEMESFTINQESVEDAVSAIEILREEEKIDRDRIFVLGHSLGGLVLPRVVEKRPEIAGMIIMAGAARPLEDYFLEQHKYLLGHTNEEEILPIEKETLDRINRDVELIKSGKIKDLEPGRMIFNAPVSYWMDLAGYSPVEKTRELNKPVLVLQGKRDYQVTLKDFNLWKTGLPEKPDNRFILYEDLNHLMVSGAGRSLPTEYIKSGNVCARVIEDIAQWIESINP